MSWDNSTLTLPILFCQSPLDPNSKKKRHLADLQYAKAAEYIDVTCFPTEWLRVNLERVALLEHQINSARSKVHGAAKFLHTILELLLNSKQAFEAFCSNNHKKAKERALKAEDDDCTGKFGDERKIALDEKDQACEGENHKFTPGNTGERRQTSPEGSDTVKMGGISKGNGRTSTEYADFSRKSKTRMMDHDDPWEFLSLADIFEERLKNCLKEQLKASSTGKTGASTQQKQRDTVLKRMFEYAPSNKRCA